MQELNGIPVKTWVVFTIWILVKYNAMFVGVNGGRAIDQISAAASHHLPTFYKGISRRGSGTQLSAYATQLFLPDPLLH